MNKSSLEYAAYFSYTPRYQTIEQSNARNHTIALKSDEKRPDGLCQSSHLVCQMAKSSHSIIRNWFGHKPILIPVPRSYPTRTGDLWVSARITTAMASAGLGRKAVPCLKRTSQVPKSAYSLSADRPKARQHYASFSVETLTGADDLVLVDDVVTRGATLLGAANRLAERFPDAKIRAFALVRTQSNPADFTKFEDPVHGLIELINGETRRRP